MESDAERGRRILDEAVELSKGIQVDVDEDYRRLIAIVEALPQNQSGSDKTWVWRMDRALREHYEKAKPA